MSIRSLPIFFRSISVAFVVIILPQLGFAQANSPSAHRETSSIPPGTILLVDKSKNQIHLAKYLEEEIKIQKTYHATLGKSLGDKQIEKDLKTPEGIYFFTQKLRPPAIKKKYGAMAMLMNYPNPMDRMAGKTGYDIMLHSTDDPTRLKRDYDSEGCIVIDNPEIEEVSQYVRVGATPIVVYPELKQEYLKPVGLGELRNAFQKWLTSWQSKDLDGYIGSYANGFRYNGMNLKQYREYKASLNSKYDSIKVGADNVQYIAHPKYNIVLFTQNYESHLKNGSTAFKSSSTKYLYFVKDSDSNLRITNEAVSQVQLN